MWRGGRGRGFGTTLASALFPFLFHNKANLRHSGFRVSFNLPSLPSARESSAMPKGGVMARNHLQIGATPRKSDGVYKAGRMRYRLEGLLVPLFSLTAASATSVSLAPGKTNTAPGASCQVQQPGALQLRSYLHTRVPEYGVWGPGGQWMPMLSLPRLSSSGEKQPPCPTFCKKSEQSTSGAAYSRVRLLALCCCTMGMGRTGLFCVYFIGQRRLCVAEG